MCHSSLEAWLHTSTLELRLPRRPHKVKPYLLLHILNIRQFWGALYKKLRFVNFGGWYVYLDFHGVISQQNVPTPEIRTHVSKRNFLYNAPLYVFSELTILTWIFYPNSV